MTEVYDPKAFIPHAASLRQAFAHCGRFSTAASRRSLGSVSVPVWVTILSDHLPVIALVSRYLTNKLIGRESIVRRIAPLASLPCGKAPHSVLIPLSRGYPQPYGRLLTRYSPVRHSSAFHLAMVPVTVRLACLIHAASVHSEPGSNSPLKNDTHC